MNEPSRLDVRRRMLTGLLASAIGWVSGVAGNADNAGIAEPAAGPRTATSTSTSSSVRSHQSAPHRSRIVVHIYARTKETREAVVKEIEKVIVEYLMDIVLDQTQDQQHIAKLTEQQVITLTSFSSHLLIT